MFKYFKRKNDREEDSSEPRPPVPKKKGKSDEKPAAGPEYAMTKNKLKDWPQKYFFWRTFDGKAPIDAKPNDERKVTWLHIDESEGTYTCFVCKKYESISNSDNAVTKGSTLWHTNVVKRHERDEEHTQCINKYRRELLPMHESNLHKSVAVAKKRLSQQKTNQVKALFNTAYYIAREGDAFRKFPTLCELQIKNGADIGEQYLSDKACRRFIGVIARQLHQDVSTEIAGARFLSVLCDGSTDASIKEQEAVYGRYVHNGYPKTKFLGIRSPVRPNAEQITKCIEEVLKTLELEDSKTVGEEEGSGGSSVDGVAENEDFLHNIMKKIINVNFDGASVMSGHKSGVRARLAEKILALLFTHCVAHRLELSVLDSIKCDKYLAEFSELVNNVFQYYYYSPVKRSGFTDLANVLGEITKRFGCMKNVRWLASRKRALSALHANYKTLVKDMESASYESTETGKKAAGYIVKLKNPRFLFYLHFFMDMVNILSNLSLQLQRDELLVIDIPYLLESTKTKLLMLSVDPGPYYKQLMEELVINDNGDTVVFRDVILEQPKTRQNTMKDVKTPQECKVIYDECFENILDGADDYLSIRFNDFSKAPLKDFIELFDYKSYPTSFKSNMKWGFDKLENILNYYENTENFTKQERVSMKQEWPLLRSRILKLKETLCNSGSTKFTSADLYGEILRENDPEMKNINILTKFMMTISVSTAACERGFSCMNRQKSKERCNLTQEALEDIMTINIDGPTVSLFDATVSLERWLDEANGHRRNRATKRSIADEEVQIVNNLMMDS